MEPLTRNPHKITMTEFSHKLVLSIIFGISLLGICINRSRCKVHENLSESRQFCFPKLHKNWKRGQHTGSAISLWEKKKSREKITLVKNEEPISHDVEVANTLNNYFSNVVKILKILEKFVTDSLPQSLSRHSTLNAILKYKNHLCM